MSQLPKLAVKLHLATQVNRELVDREKPEVVVVATGAVPLIPNIPGAEGEKVVTAFDLLEGKLEAGNKVVIIGGGGIGCETALYLVYCLSNTLTGQLGLRSLIDRQVDLIYGSAQYRPPKPFIWQCLGLSYP